MDFSKAFLIFTGALLCASAALADERLDDESLSTDDTEETTERERFLFYDPSGIGAHAFHTPWGIILESGFEEYGHKSIEKLNLSKGQANILKAIDSVGLGYITLGQSSTTLSGGESQRIKLATELAKKDTGKTLYILDEPTTGLHFDDIKKLLEILHKLVSYGNTVIVIEHNLDVINTSDWIIDLGPEGGERGGNILFEGKPKDLIKNKNNQTGIYLKKYQESLALSTAS